VRKQTESHPDSVELLLDLKKLEEEVKTRRRRQERL
jgi:hypothetical protein